MSIQNGGITPHVSGASPQIAAGTVVKDFGTGPYKGSNYNVLLVSEQGKAPFLLVREMKGDKFEGLVLKITPNKGDPSGLPNFAGVAYKIAAKAIDVFKGGEAKLKINFDNHEFDIADLSNKKIQNVNANGVNVLGAPPKSENELDKLKGQLKDLRENYKSRGRNAPDGVAIAAVEKRIAQLEGQAAQGVSIGPTPAEVAEAKKLFKELGKAIESQTEKLSSLESKIGIAKKKISELETTYKELSAKLAAEDDSEIIGQIGDTMDKLSKLMASHTKHLAILNNELTTSRDIVVKMEQSRVDLQKMLLLEKNRVKEK